MFELALIAIIGVLAMFAYNLFASLQTENILVKVSSHEKLQQLDYFLLASVGNDYIRYKALSFYGVKLSLYCKCLFDAYNVGGIILLGSKGYDKVCDYNDDGRIDSIDISNIQTNRPNETVDRLPCSYMDLQHYYMNPSNMEFPIPYGFSTLYYMKYGDFKDVEIDQSVCWNKSAEIPALYEAILRVYDPFLKTRSCGVGILGGKRT
ncbi:MAG: hypothetical protein QW507_02430 [Candidatus Nanoarchaeia archaeon]|nr:hypothetical protein [Candidatus Haiyanarchaeum thermophilum]MCW1308066.1 hypothetical protein [Candidatus Haiyanarchaeum thermophilum]MCW1308842.1 hypothetical protein [Candidatus Haiyanarchaeum thermophilum]